MFCVYGVSCPTSWVAGFQVFGFLFCFFLGGFGVSWTLQPSRGLPPNRSLSPKLLRKP